MFWSTTGSNEPEMGKAMLQLWQLSSLQTSSESSNATHQQKNLSPKSLESSVSGTRKMSRKSSALKEINTVISDSSAISGTMRSRGDGIAVPQPEPPLMVLFIMHEGEYSFLHLERMHFISPVLSR